MLFFLTISACLVLVPSLVLVGTWLKHLPSATEICERVGKLGKGDSGHFSLAHLGDCRTCEFSTVDGVTLRGSYLRCRTGKRIGVVLFCHEFGGDRHVATPYMADLLEQGFDVFAFDFRNHGESDRMEGYSPRTWVTQYEVFDVQAAISYLRSLEDADPEGIAIVGLSRGGSAALSAASQADGIWAMVTDGAFVSRWVTTANIRRFMPQFVRLAPVLTQLPWWVHVIYGSVVHDLVARQVKHPCRDVARDVRRLRVPLLMIHGGRDSTIPVELAYRLHKRLPQRTRLWVVPKSSHNRSIRTQPTRYRRRVSRFLRNYAPGMVRNDRPMSATVSQSTIEYGKPVESARPTVYASTTVS